MKNTINKNLRKVLSIALCLALVMSYVPTVSITAGAAANSVSYVDYTWNEESKTLSSETKSVDTYTEITSTTTEMTSGWYVVNGEVTVAERMTATGEVHLILADGAHLTASLGITVNEGNSLYIYGQSSDENTMGKLTATATDYDAAIGGLMSNHAGTIVINGGNINASASKQGAGIGSGASCGGYQITINAGVVTATSSSSPAAIGSGNNRGSGVRGTVHSICINGGVVNATSFGAAIGGGSLFDGGDITITGGTVTATSAYQGAAIGGGYDGSGGNITITGGNVTATHTHSIYAGAAIGAGYYGESAGNILITGGTVTATSKSGCGIGAYNGDNGRIVILGGTVNASGSGTVHIKAGASGSMMLVDGTTVTISGDFTLQTDFVLPEGYTLEISEGATLTIPEGVTLTLPKEYTLISNGTVNAVGTVNCITHKYVEGVCICGLECSHVGGTPTCTAPAVCTTCGTAYGEVDPTNHNWENGVCTYGCNTIHEPHDWSGKDGICTVCGATCTHTGGTATCKTQAVCEVCEVSYGELDPDNHEYEKNNGICCDTYQHAELNEDNYYEISNAGQLFWFANYINTVDRTANAVLTADIDLENRPWTPIGSTGENSNNFRGIFDGQNHTIKGLYVEGGRAGLGFFGEVRTGTVKNFTIYGEVVANTDVNYVGGVIGSICGLNGDNDLERNGAIIQNITSYVNLTAKTHGIGMIGGFVGYANHESLIENCSWYGTFDAGEYRVDSGAGGFIGKIQESTSSVTIRNCGAYGTIKTNYAKNSYNNTATIYMGGFLSFSNTDAQTAIENCLFAGKFERGENLTDEARLGAFGTLRSVNAIKNCYYLGDDGLEAVHSDSDLKPGSDNVEITSVTKAQLLSGEVAYLLGEAWGQMSNTEGSLPIITDNELYKVVTVGETGNYSVANVGDTNDDGIVDVTDYQALVNKALADDHEQIETASYDDIVKYDLDGDGYLDVIDAYLLHLFINGFTTVDVYAVGDYDLNGMAFEEADIKAIKHAIENPEKLATYKKYASDINGDGKLDENDLTALTSKYGEVTGTECADNVEVYYRWGNKYSTCTATAMCTLCGKKVATETVNTTSETLSELTCTQDGEIKYTATFTNELFEEKIKTVTTDMLPHNLSDGVCTVCGIIDATNMTADELETAVAELLLVGKTNITVALAEDAEQEMFSAIRTAFSESTAADGSINLTVSGAKTVPDYGFFDIDDYYDNDDKNIAGDKLKSLTLTDVKTIGDFAFSACTYLESVNLPQVVTIGECAFNEWKKGTKLTSLDLPNATTIGDWAFAYSSLLTSVNLPKVTSIGVLAFGYCDLRTLDLPEATTIGGEAFMNNYNLVSCSAPKATTIDYYPWGSNGTSKLERLELTVAGDFTLGNNLFAYTPTEQIDLVLNKDKESQVTQNDDGTATWKTTNSNGGKLEYTFKSITFVGE